MQRKDQLISGRYYHVTSKSIAGYRIFNSDTEYQRMLKMIRYFSYRHSLPKFSQFHSFPFVQANGFESSFLDRVDEADRLVRIIAYCLMPTHLHLVLEQKKPDGISKVMGNTLNAYARYFNVKHKRQGPLWMGRFKGIPVSSDEQLLHLTRYLHLNSVSAGIVRKASEWEYSSYTEYVSPKLVEYPLCDYGNILRVIPAEYRAFVDDYAGSQRELAILKKAMIEGF